MTVQCPDCKSVYDDEHQWTICPHGPLWAGVDAYCKRHDLVNCPLCRMEKGPKEGITNEKES
jgi:hypothetical protein